MAGRIISQVDFIEYLQGLAAEGETSLIVRQKPKMKGGQPLVHVDGTAPLMLASPPRECRDPDPAITSARVS